MRVHPAVIEIVRVASDDDIIPLSKQVVGVSRKVYDKIAIPKGTVVAVSPYGHNLCAISKNNRVPYLLTWRDPAGIEGYGVLMPTSGVQNGGLRQPRILNHRWEYMGICMSRLFNLLSAADTFLVPLFPEVLEPALDGNLRSSSWSISRKETDTG